MIRRKLFNDLPTLKEEDRLDLHITFEEITDAVKQLSTGRAPGFNGLTADFYKSLWGIIGQDFFESEKVKVPYI